VSKLPTTVSLHVGCGGTTQTWWSDNWTPGTGASGSRILDAVCNEGTIQPKKGANSRCAYQSVGTTIVNAAAAMLNKPYCWDGGIKTGPSHGSGNVNGATHCGPTSVVGFDCSGLTLFAVFHATGTLLPHFTGSQVGYGTRITSVSSLRPGDLVFFGRGSPEHVGIYAGSGKVWDANVAYSSYPDGVQLRALQSEYPFLGGARFG